MKKGQVLVVLAALLWGLAECDLESQNKHAERNKKEIMLDPTATTGSLQLKQQLGVAMQCYS